MGNSRVQIRFSTNLPVVARIAIDISPLGKSVDFRNLWAAGQMRATSMAAATTLTFSITFGGIACVIAMGLLAIFMPKFHRYGAKTNEFALAKILENDLRENTQ